MGQTPGSETVRWAEVMPRQQVELEQSSTNGKVLHKLLKSLLKIVVMGKSERQWS